MTTRVFYVVDTPAATEEIFHSKQKAEEEFQKMAKLSLGVQLYIAEVEHSYFEKELGRWNYDDQADAFTIIKFLKG